MKHLISSLSFLILISIFFSCSEEATNITLKQKELIPGKIGNFWVYQDSIAYSSDWKTDTVAGWITSSQIVNIAGKNTTVYSQTEYNSKDEQTVQILISNEPDGLYVYGGDADTSSIELRNILLKYSVNTDDKWQCIYRYYVFSENKFHHDTSDVTCKGINEPITTPAGTFNCIKYEYKVGDNQVTTEYFAPGIGMIAHFDDIGTVVYKRILIKYKIN